MKVPECYDDDQPNAARTEEWITSEASSVWETEDECDDTRIQNGKKIRTQVSEQGIPFRFKSGSLDIPPYKGRKKMTFPNESKPSNIVADRIMTISAAIRTSTSMIMTTVAPWRMRLLLWLFIGIGACISYKTLDISSALSQGMCRMSAQYCAPVLPPPPPVPIKLPNVAHLSMLHDEAIVPILSGTADRSECSLKIRRMKPALVDLVVRVSASPLTSRARIAETLLDFQDLGNRVSERLVKFDAVLFGAVDNILVAQNQLIRSIDEINQHSFPVTTSTSAIALSQKAEVEFRTAADISQHQTKKLILAAHATLRDLHELDEMLNVLDDSTNREEKSPPKLHGFAWLWDALRGSPHEKEVKDIIRRLREYSTEARLHVKSTLRMLKRMEDDMERFRHGLSAAVLLDGQDGVASPTLAAQIEYISSGVQRLREGRQEAKVFLLENAQQRAKAV